MNYTFYALLLFCLKLKDFDFNILIIYIISKHSLTFYILLPILRISWKSYILLFYFSNELRVYMHNLNDEYSKKSSMILMNTTTKKQINEQKSEILH